MKKLLLFFVLIAGVVLSGCEGTEDPDVLPTVASIATFEGSADGLSTFSYTEADGSTVTLTAGWNAPSELPAGARVLIYYRAEQYGVSTQIALMSVTRIPTSKVETAPRTDIPVGVELTEARVWRSGQWINLGAIISFSGDAKAIDLIVDRESLADSVAQAYVVVLPQADAVPAAQRQLYASFDADSIFNLPQPSALNINLSATKAVLIKK